MIKCNRCGTELPDFVKFCDNCGVKVEIPESAETSKPNDILKASEMDSETPKFGDAKTTYGSSPSTYGSAPDTYKGSQGDKNVAPEAAMAPVSDLGSAQKESSIQPGTPMGGEPMSPNQPGVPMGGAPMSPNQPGMPMGGRPMPPNQPGMPMSGAPMPPNQPGMPMGAPQPQYGGVTTAKRPIDNKIFIFGGIGLVAIVAIILAIIFIPKLFAGSSDDPNAGMWIGTKASMMGLDINVEDISPEGINIELNDGGKCTLFYNGLEYGAKWELDGTTFTLIDGTDEFAGTLIGNELKLVNLLDLGMDIIFYKEGTEVPSAAGTADNNSENTQGEVPLDGQLIGRYDISAVKIDGEEVTAEELIVYGMQDDYIYFIDDSSLEMKLFGELSPPLDFDPQTMTFMVNGDPFILVAEGNTITYSTQGMDVTFVYSTSQERDGDGSTSSEGENTTAGFTPPGLGSEQTIYVDTIGLPTEWYGELVISDYQGDANYIEGVYESYAYVNYDADGVPYFELYIEGHSYESYSSVVISFNCEMGDSTFFPIVDDYAWINIDGLKYGDNNLEYVVPFEAEAEIHYSPTLVNGILSATYYYSYGGESFTMTYNLSQIDY